MTVVFSPSDGHLLPPRRRQDSDLDNEESQIAASFAAINAYNGPMRKSNPDIPETIAEAE